MLNKLFFAQNIKSLNIMYGYLYNWYAVDTGLLAPSGWSIPTDAEYTAFSDYIIADYAGIDATNIGNALKSCRQDGSPLGGACDTSVQPYWIANATHYGTNDFGFSAIPGNLRLPLTGFNTSLNKNFYVWTTTESGSDGFSRTIFNNAGTFGRFTNDKRYGFYVRCFRAASVAEAALDDGDACDKAYDINGNIYDTIKIDDKVWMVQNLAVTKFNNGTDIPNLTDNTDWANDTDGARCALDNDEDYVFTDLNWI